MAHSRDVQRILLSFTVLFACASGEEDSKSSGFNVTQNPAGPGGDTTSADLTTDAVPTTSDGMRETSEGTMRLTTTESPDPSTETASDTSTGEIDVSSSTTGEDSSTGPVVLCGNGVIDAPEECDGADLNAMDCASLGFSGGTLVCTPQCIFDKAMCTSPSCGDMNVDAGEECDCGQQGANCTATQLNNAACNTLPAPNGGNYSAGTLMCNSPGSCSYNKAGCVYCGDGIKNAAELCDAADLGGQTCASQGFAGGGLACTAQCALNTAGCTNCGNGQINPGEQCDGANFNGQSCASINPNLYAGGNLSCSGGCDSIATSGCNSGNCCVTGGAGACAVNAIRTCVCNLDPYCCNNAWDGICVGEAKNNCGAVC